MTRSKELKRKTSRCCWRKLLGKALKRDPGGPHQPHQCFDQDEIVYLNLYLTSLEKKMQAIEEITRLKWYRQQMCKSTGEAQNYIRSGFKYFKEDCKPLSTMDGYSNELSTVSIAARKPEVLRCDSEAIIREIMSLGSKNYRQVSNIKPKESHCLLEPLVDDLKQISNDLDYESRKWAALVAPQQEPIITEPDKIIEINVEMEPEVSMSKPSFSVVGKYHVAAMSYLSETHVATQTEGARVQEPTARIRASCSIDFFDNEAKTIEIAYDNREWDKKGTIVLRDIENQIGVQTELIGRVVCFLLGMGEVDLA